jgi:aquaporin related protein
MALIGAIGWLKAAALIITQILAGIAAAAVVSGLFSGPLSVRTRLEGHTSVVRGLFIEMFLTFELIFCIFMLAAEKHRSTFLAPIGIGLALFIAELAGERLRRDTCLLPTNDDRRLLHWWLTQPCSLLWS